MFGLTKKQIGILVASSISCLLFAVFGIVFNDLVNLIITAELKKNLPLKNGSMAFAFWQNPPVSVNFGIYVFHVANPDEVMDGTEVPAVVEMGPYVYRMSIEKTNIKWHDNNTLEYIQPQHFIFDRELSVGPDTDTFMTINIPYITVATILQHEPPFLQDIVDTYFAFHGETAFMNRSVYDIWWGYHDPVLEEAAKILHGLNISSPMLNGKFGFFMDKNNTGDGLYNIFSGVNEQFDNYVNIDRWNTLKHQSIWRSDYANEIRGSDGSMHPPLLNSDSKLSIFDAYLQRSLKLQYSGPSSSQGLRTLRFHVPFSEFASGDENHDNLGFCTPDCIPSGAYNMSVACYNAPIYVSLPHFVGGDDYYQSLVKGLSPSPSQHQPIYDIHPIIGVTLKLGRRYQLNVLIQNFTHFKSFEHFPLSYLPILWIDGGGDVDVYTAIMLKEKIQDPLDVIPYIHWAVIGASGFFLIISIVLFIYWRKKNVKLLYNYTKIEDSEDSKLNGTMKTNYGADSHLRNQLNTQENCAVAIIEHHEPNTPVDANNSSGHIESENLEANLQNDSSHEQSFYFDTLTSPERSDKSVSLA